MAAEPIEAPKTTETGLTDAERHELLRLRAYRRRQQRQQTIYGGMLGGGMLLAGFGLIPGLAGMVLGGFAGYLFERHADREHAKQLS